MYVFWTWVILEHTTQLVTSLDFIKNKLRKVIGREHGLSDKQIKLSRVVKVADDNCFIFRELVETTHKNQLWSAV